MKRALAAYASVFGIGYLGYMLLPATLSAAADRFALGETEIGLAATLQLTGLAIALFVVAPRLVLIGGRRAALAGGALAIAGYVLASLAGIFPVFLLGLFIAGLGSGSAIAGGDAFVSGAPNPGRLFAFLFAFGQLTAIIMLIAILPALVEQYGNASAYGALAVLSTAMVVVVIFCPVSPSVADASEPIPELSLYLAAPVVAMFFLGIADAAVWPFSGEIGKSLGLNGGDGELVLAGALAAGVLGAGAAGFFSETKSKIPAIFVIFFLAACYAGVLTAPNIAVYSSAQILALFMYGFLTPFLLGLCGLLDRTGGMMAAAAGSQMIGLAISPWLAGTIMGSFGTAVLAGLIAMSVIIIWPLYMSGRRQLSEMPE